MSDGRFSSGDAMETSFGFRDIDAQEKQPLVNSVFHNVAARYDLMNDLMSGGLHRVWKGAMVTWLNPPARDGWRSLDVAGGTGDIAFRIVDASKRTAHVTVLDINSSMLAEGESRASQRGQAGHFDFVEANAEQLPFKDDSFDAYTIAFGIRNVPRISLALSEAYRVLKPGGRFLCLEFSEVSVPLLDRAYEIWSAKAIPAIGQAVTGDGDAYRYLVESIARFPAQGDFAAAIGHAGFGRVKWRDYTGGIAALHSGWKI